MGCPEKNFFTFTTRGEGGGINTVHPNVCCMRALTADKTQ